MTQYKHIIRKIMLNTGLLVLCLLWANTTYGSMVEKYDIRIKSGSGSQLTFEWGYDSIFPPDYSDFNVGVSAEGKGYYLATVNSPIEHTINNYDPDDVYNVSVTWGGFSWKLKIKNYMTGPRNLSAVNVSDSNVTLNWDYASPNIHGFRVYRDGNLLATLGSSARSYSDPTVNASTTYNYKVVGCIDVNSSPLFLPVMDIPVYYRYSPESTISVTTLAGGNNDTVTLDVTNKTKNSITLAWEGTLNYKLFSASNLTNPIFTSSGSSTYTNSGLTPATNYSYTLKGYDANNNFIGETCISTNTLTDENVTLNCINKTKSSITLKWVGSLFYKLYKDSSDIPIFTTSGGKSFTDPYVAPNTSYSYILRGYDVQGYLIGESTVSVTTLKNDSFALSKAKDIRIKSVAEKQLTLEWGYDFPKSAPYEIKGGSISHRINSTTANTEYTIVNYLPQEEYLIYVSAIEGPIKIYWKIIVKNYMTKPVEICTNGVTTSKVLLNWEYDGNTHDGFMIFRNGYCCKTIPDKTASSCNMDVSSSSINDYAIVAYIDGNTSPLYQSGNKKFSPESKISVNALHYNNNNMGFLCTSKTENSISLAWQGPHNYKLFKDSQIPITTSMFKYYTDKGLSPNTGYYYTLKAYDYSNNDLNLSLSINGITDPISAPTGFIAKAPDCYKIKLSWNSDPFIKKYYIKRKRSNSAIYDTIRVFESAIDSYDDEGLVSGDVYHYRIQAEDWDGNLSAEANAFAFTETFQATANWVLHSFDMYNLNIQWEPANIPDDEMNEYKLYRKAPSETDYTLVQNSNKSIRYYNDQNLAPNTSYQYKLEATDALGNTSSPSFITYTTKAFQVPVFESKDESYYTINFSWTAPLEVPTVSKYLVYRTKSGEAEELVDNNYTNLNYNDINLDSNTNYTYRVVAVDPYNNKSDSLCLNLKTLQIPAPGNLAIDETKSYQLTITWEPPSSPPISGYTITQDGVLVKTLNEGTDYPAGTASFSFTTQPNLTDGTPYTFIVKAFDSKGGVSASASVTGQTLALPPPSNISQQQWTYKLQLNWSKPATIASSDIKGYKIIRTDKPTEPIIQAGTTYTVSNLVDQTDYIFNLWTIDQADNVSNTSTTFTASTLALPPPQDFIQPQQWTYKNAFSWSKPTAIAAEDIDGYIVQRQGSAKPETPQTSTSFLEDNLSDNTSYSYTVWTVDKGGNQSNSPITVNFSTLQFTAPLNLTLGDVNTYKMGFSWAKPDAPIMNEDITGYEVFFGDNNTPIATLTNSQTSYEHDTLKPDTPYLFKVKAVDPAGNRSEPASSPVTTDENAWKTIVFESPENLSVDSFSTYKVDLSWTNSPTDTDKKGFKVFKNDSTISETGLIQDLSHSDSNLKPYTSYTFTVNAVDEAGNLSLPATITQKTLRFRAPRNFTATAISTCRINLSWIVPWSDVAPGVITDFEGYKIFIAGDDEPLITINNKDATTGEAYPLQHNKTYSLIIKAFDAAGNMSYQASKDITTATMSAPQNLRVSSLSETSAKLSWDPVTFSPATCNKNDMIGYRVYRHNGEENILVTETTVLSCVVDGLTAGTPFTFSVSAYDTNSENFFPSAEIKYPTVPNGPKTIVLEFNDNGTNWNTPVAGTVTDTGDPGGNNGTVSGDNALWIYNEHGGSAIQFKGEPVSSMIQLQQPVTFAKRFVLETKLYAGGEATPEIELLRGTRFDTPTGPILWKINADRTVSLRLPADNDYTITSIQPVLQDKQWTSLQVVVNSDKTTIQDAIKLYKNGEALECTYPTADLATILSEIDTSLLNTALLKRNAAVTLKCDFVKIQTNLEVGTFDTDNFSDGEVFEEVEPDASATVVVDLDNLLKRVINPPSDFDTGKHTGDAVQYDNHPETETKFYGMFEINFGIDVFKYNGILTIDIMAKKPGANHPFKKIGQVRVDSNNQPAANTGIWWHKFYWNSREPAYNWTKEDAQPYETNEVMQFKFVVR